MQPTCYLCEAPKTSREHAPPRCLFPHKKDLTTGKDLRRNLISVHSCDEHNSEKSTDDEYLMWILAAQSQGNQYKQLQFQTKGRRAFRRRPGGFLSLLENLTPSVIIGPDGTSPASVSFETDVRRFERCMWHTATALYFDATGNKWKGGYRVFTDVFVRLKGVNVAGVNETSQHMTKRFEALLTAVPARGENPEIFFYKLVSPSETKHLVHMTFYEGIQVSVLLSDA